MTRPLVLNDFAPVSLLNFLIYEENFNFFFISAVSAAFTKLSTILCAGQGKVFCALYNFSTMIKFLPHEMLGLKIEAKRSQFSMSLFFFCA